MLSDVGSSGIFNGGNGFGCGIVPADGFRLLGIPRFLNQCHDGGDAIVVEGFVVGTSERLPGTGVGDTVLEEAPDVGHPFSFDVICDGDLGVNGGRCCWFCVDVEALGGEGIIPSHPAVGGISGFV